jgi:DNA-binding NtrC family response regulator
MVQGTALRHNGSVKLKTKEGDTSFIVMIPVVKEQKMVTSKLRMEKKAGRRKILHVDDEMAILEIFKMHFEQHGYDSESFPEGSGAIEYFKTHSNEFDAVLLDVAVPPSGGEQIFDEVKKIRPSIPVAFVTGYYESKADDLREKGAFAVFEKPVNFKAVFQELDCIIEQTRS